MPSSIAAIIPAAGYSSRMGRFKPLLPLGRTTVIQRLVSLFSKAGIRQITVVSGHRAFELQNHLFASEAAVVYNPDYSRGMFSSILAGMAGLDPAAEAVFILPADIPLIRENTLLQLMQAFQQRQSPIIYPVFQGQRGHPPLIRRDLLNVARHWNGDGGLRAFLEQHDAAAREVRLFDQGVVQDMDHPEDYEAVCARFPCLDLPTLEECRFLQQCCDTGPAVEAHCRLVAETARALGRELNSLGFALDLDLLFCGGLLHDLVRHLPDHAAKGSQILADHGFSRVAAVVARHADGCFGEQEPITEQELVYLADKLVQDQTRVSLEDRFQHKLEAFKDRPDAYAAVRLRLQRARQSLERVEAALGKSVESVGTSNIERRTSNFE